VSAGGRASVCGALIVVGSSGEGTLGGCIALFWNVLHSGHTNVVLCCGPVAETRQEKRKRERCVPVVRANNLRARVLGCAGAWVRAYMYATYNALLSFVRIAASRAGQGRVGSGQGQGRRVGQRAVSVPVSIVIPSSATEQKGNRRGQNYTMQCTHNTLQEHATAGGIPTRVTNWSCSPIYIQLVALAGFGVASASYAQ
jgi:hypothetical protein